MFSSRGLLLAGDMVVLGCVGGVWWLLQVDIYLGILDSCGVDII